ncbi:methyltransferase domain protein [Gemella bergeri ATCC 700627]|uniref:Methyltransferase domain protein n=1 Tax=Gemella bergeri ATCC 700627 TaxID=1321820 RepID=U2QTB9_9BACL|nr:methyltransferase domain-containing protein [Gemella bergeri]ERK59449.1 methyltransferase domain protein [Gemella bergeri ATCC 700627]
MRIENVIKKFNQDEIYRCPMCCANSKITEISLLCENNHRYDFSKKGYIHLINNYKATKYNEELFIARKNIFETGFYKPVLEVLKVLMEKYSKKVVVDVGCGEGYYIRNLKKMFPNKYFFGLDNSKSALETAVKVDKDNPYMLANLAALPFKDKSVSCVLNILTPANYEEFFRVLGEEGYLIKIIPNADYLKEIRDLVSVGEYTNCDTIKLIENTCDIVERTRISNTYRLTEILAENFLKMTPLTFSKELSEDDIKSLKEITIDLEILVCRKKYEIK